MRIDLAYLGTALSKLNLDQMIAYDDNLEFSVGQLKQSHPGYQNPLIVLHKFPTDRCYASNLISKQQKIYGGKNPI